jgi:hypothetical protein
MKTRTVRLLAGCAAACMVAITTTADVGRAQGQPPNGTRAWPRARLDNRLDARTRAAVEKAIDSAVAEGLPAEPLVSKALHGAAVGARGEAIVKAVRVLAERLAVARDVLGPGSTAVELDAGVAALQAGVQPEVLERIRNDRAQQPLAVPLGVLADLIGRGVSTKDATQMVVALVRRGTTDEQLLAFQRDVERDIGIGAPPAAAVELRGLAFSQAGNPLPGGNRPGAQPRPKP